MKWLIYIGLAFVAYKTYQLYANPKFAGFVSAGYGGNWTGNMPNVVRMDGTPYDNMAASITTGFKGVVGVGPGSAAGSR